MEIYKESNSSASKEFEKLLDNQISKTKNLVEGKIIKEGFTGIYFRVKGKKLQTSLKIHTEAGGDPELFLAWEKSLKNKLK